ncbi:MAG: hypothetical protein IK000_01665 [Bacteroidaceae bacterium]|nr:hypothetical protein [Bacteroidaceae bacterium]
MSPSCTSNFALSVEYITPYSIASPCSTFAKQETTAFDDVMLETPFVTATSSESTPHSSQEESKNRDINVPHNVSKRFFFIAKIVFGFWKSIIAAKKKKKKEKQIFCRKVSSFFTVVLDAGKNGTPIL